MDIEINEDAIRLGQLLKFANIVTDGGEAKALIASGAVSVDGEPETRRGRQVGIGSRVEVDLPQGRQQFVVVPQDPSSARDQTGPIRPGDNVPDGADGTDAGPARSRRQGGLAGAMPRTQQWLRRSQD